MTALLAVVPVLLAALGGAGVVLGELDDSPGLQGLSCLLVLGCAAVSYRRTAAAHR